MINNIALKLDERQYQRVTVNIDGIILYYSVNDNDVYLIAVFDISMLRELNIVQYKHIIDQMKLKFINKRYERVSLLSILCTDNPDSVKEFCVDTDDHWILDTKQDRLIIYENQKSDYLDMISIIDEIIKGHEEGGVQRYNIFSLFNTVIMGINILVFIVLEFLGSTQDTEFMLRHGALYWPYIIGEGQWYRVFTYMFLHYGVSHILNNILILAFLGDNLERAVGKIRYIIIYLGAGVIAGLASMGYNMLQKYNVIAVGASGAIFGVVGGLLYAVVINRGHLENMSAKRLIIFAALSIYGGFTSQGTDNVAHVAGFIAGILITIILYKKPNKSEVSGI